MKLKMLLAVPLIVVISCTAQAGVMTFTSGGSSSASARDDYPQTGDRYHSSVSYIGATDSFYAEASASYGTMKVYASGAANGKAATSAFAEAVITDTITLNNDALTGQRGFLTLSFYSDSILSAGDFSPYWPGGTSASYSLDIIIGSSRLILSRQEIVDDDPTWSRSTSRMWFNDATGTGDTEIAGKYFTLTQEFIWGSPLGYWMGTNVGGYHSGYPYGEGEGLFGNFVADSSHSTYWDGIKSVTTNGVNIANYTITSGSGTDYSHSFVPTADVPEPGTLSLIVISLASLAGLTRRQGRS
jgi:hypothetical protein